MMEPGKNYKYIINRNFIYKNCKWDDNLKEWTIEIEYIFDKWYKSDCNIKVGSILQQNGVEANELEIFQIICGDKK